MPTRPGFARLLPLMAFTGLAAGTVALLASAQPVQAPERRIVSWRLPDDDAADRIHPTNCPAGDRT